MDGDVIAVAVAAAIVVVVDCFVGVIIVVVGVGVRVTRGADTVPSCIMAAVELCLLLLLLLRF